MSQSISLRFVFYLVSGNDLHTYNTIGRFSHPAFSPAWRQPFYSIYHEHDIRHRIIKPQSTIFHLTPTYTANTDSLEGTHSAYFDIFITCLLLLAFCAILYHSPYHNHIHKLISVRLHLQDKYKKEL